MMVCQSLVNGGLYLPVHVAGGMGKCVLGDRTVVPLFVTISMIHQLGGHRIRYYGEYCFNEYI